MSGRRMATGGVDRHRNTDKTDNRRRNIRVCNAMENAWNVQISKNNKTGVRGVHWNERLGCYVAQIMERKHAHHLGCFTTLEEAAVARRAAEIKYYGSFAPDWD